MSNRLMIYVPDLIPGSFVLFYYVGDLNGHSYSLRDYSKGGSPILYTSDNLPDSANEILKRAKFCFDAERVKTGDCEYWKRKTDECNRLYLKLNQKPAAALLTSEVLSPEQPAKQNTVENRQQAVYPILAETKLRTHPVKGKKTGDLNRIFTSPISEDYVTWNVTQLLLEQPSSTWWPVLLKLAREDNPSFDLQYDLIDCPELHLWCKYPAPQAYERRSRERMAHSGIADWEERSHLSGPVEGESEIDFIAEGNTFIVFAEAKLTSDISERTTYDPARNQIIRNIDVLLEVCGSRKPIFWMLVKEKSPQSLFMKTIEKYRNDPTALAEALPHRDPQVLRRVAQNIAVLCWRDILALLAVDDSRPAVREVLRRVDSRYKTINPVISTSPPEPLPTDCGADQTQARLEQESPARKEKGDSLTIIARTSFATMPFWLCYFLYWLNTSPPSNQVVIAGTVVIALLTLITIFAIKSKD